MERGLNAGCGRAQAAAALCRSGPLHPQRTQPLTLGLQLAALQQLLLGQQPLIELIHPRQTLLDRRDHLLFQQGDFLFSLGLLDPGPVQRQPLPQLQDPLSRLEAGFEQQNLTLEP
jgi:hypothetical protein